MGNLHFMFEFYWWQKQQQAEAHSIENTQLNEGNQLEEEHPDLCNEASEERSECIFQLLVKDDVKKNQINKIKQNESEHT